MTDDLTAVTNAERAAREAEARLQALLDHAPMPMTLRDLDGRFVLINRRAAEVMGRTAEEVIRLAPEEVYDSDIVHAVDEHERPVRAGEGAITFEIAVPDVDGRERDYLVTKYPVTDGEGRTVGVGAISVDISDRKQAEAALRAAEAGYRDLFENSPIGIARVAVDGAPLTVNPAWASLMGYDTPEQFTTEVASTSELYEDPAERDAMTDAVLEHGEVTGSEVRLRRRDGSVVWAALDVRTITNAAGDVVGLQGSGIDITERKRFEQSLREANVKLERANRANDRFLSRMSHELRTPMNAVLGFTGTLLMGVHGPVNDDQRAQLRTVQRSGRHLLSLINDLLELARIESGELELALEPVDCRAALDEVAEGLRPLAVAKGLALEVAGGLEPVELICNRHAVNQVLIRLTSNAISFTDAGSVRLELTRRVDGDRLVTRFAVVDTGCGIAPDAQERLSAAFAQIGTADARPFEGAGLGLYISQTLATVIGGEVTFESTPGKGTTFALELTGSAS
jgi:PAS domain S-box-containing protein